MTCTIYILAPGEEIIDIHEVLKGLESSFTNAQGILTKIKEVLSNND